MDDQHLDGNGVAALLEELAGRDMTSVMRVCPSCGDRSPVGEHRAFRAAGVVLRCPSCDDVALVVVEQEERLVVDWHGRYELPR